LGKTRRKEASWEIRLEKKKKVDEGVEGQSR